MSERPFIKRPRRSIFREGRHSLSSVKDHAMVGQIGFTMAGCVAFCFWVGYKLDAWLNTHGILLALFIVMGVVGGGWTVYRQIQDLYKKD